MHGAASSVDPPYPRFSGGSVALPATLDARAPRAATARRKPGSWRSDPDVALMERVRDGDTDAFRTLFEKYSGSLVTFAHRFLGSRERAEEVAQTTFLQLFRSRHRYQPRARFATFLYRIAINLCLNELRKFDYARRLDSLDALDGTDSTTTPILDRLPDVDSPQPPDHVAAREIATEVARVLERLPTNQRAALLLSRVEGASYHEVADTLGMSVSAVKSLIFRATAELRRRLKRHLEPS